MKTKITLSLVFLSFLIGSCKKQDPQIPPGNAPVFSFAGTVNGASVNLQAGVSNYYMSTSYALDANGVYDYMGELKNYSCSSNCPNSLKIYIKDYRKYSLGATNIDSSITPGYYSFAIPSGKASQYNVQFNDVLSNGTAQTYTWNFGDGSTAYTHNPIHLYDHPGIYNVSLSTQSTTSCISSVNNDVMIGQTGNPITMGFAGTYTTGTTVYFGSSISGGTPPYALNWNFGDGNTLNTGATTSTTYSYSAQGVYAASLSVTDAANVTQIYHANVATQGASGCYVNFNPPTVITPITNPANLANVTIEWRDAGGILYTSANNSQSFTSKFKVISVDNYQNNSAGQTTKKVHAKVTCTLYNGATPMPFDGDIIFGIAYP